MFEDSFSYAAMQCAVSASHHIKSSNNAPQATTVNQLRYKCIEITEKKYNKPNGRKGQIKAANKNSTCSKAHNTARTRTKENS